MARRAKTVIGRGAQEQSRTMMEAGRSGTAARQRATESLARQHDVGSQQGQQMARLGADAAYRHEQQQQQRRELDFRREATTGQQMLQKRGQELQEAERGYERVPGGEDLPLLEDRRRRVEAEMGRGTAQQAPGAPQQGGQQEARTGQPGGLEGQAPPETSQRSPEEVARLQAQGEQPVEFGQQGGAAPGVEDPGALRLSEAGRRRETRADYQAETQRLHAQARMMEVQNKAMKAEFSGDKEAVKLIRGELNSKLEHQQNLFTRMMNQNPRPNDFSTLQKWANEMGGLNDMQDGGQLQQIIQDGMKSGVGPQRPADQRRLQGFIQSYMDRQSMQFAVALGEIPGEFVDFSGPIMQQFGQATQQVKAIMQMQGPAFQAYNGITSQAEKIRFLNRTAAAMVLSGVSGGMTAMEPPEQGTPGGMAAAPTPEFPEEMPPGAGMQEMDLPVAEHRGDIEFGPNVDSPLGQNLPGDANYTEKGFQKYEQQRARS